MHLENLHQELVQKCKVEFTDLFDMLLTPKSIMSDSNTNKTIALLTESRRQEPGQNNLLREIMITNSFEIVVK